MRPRLQPRLSRAHYGTVEAAPYEDSVIPAMLRRFLRCHRCLNLPVITLALRTGVNLFFKLTFRRRILRLQHETG